jgi:hypothetical protein
MAKRRGPRKTVDVPRNIRAMQEAGFPREQAVAATMRTKRKKAARGGRSKS